jgi:hypothetical protein
MWDPREDSYIQELAARIEALEAAQQQPDHLRGATEMVDTGWRNLHDLSPIYEPAPAAKDFSATAPPAPAGGLMERLGDVWNEGKPLDPAARRAAIREIAAATDQMAPDRNLTWERVALWLEREANQ